MRIAYVSADAGVPVFGRKGCSIHVQEVVRALRGRGARVELFTPRPGGPPPADLADLPDLPVHLLPSVAGRSGRERERRAVALDGPLASALRAAGPFDMVYERYSLWSRAGMGEARRSGASGVLEVNAPLIEEQAAHRGLHDRRTAERVRDEAFAAATALVCVSDEVAAWSRRAGAQAARVHVVPNGVDVGRFRPAPEGPAARDTLTVGFVGTLKPWHGVETLIAAVARLAEAGGGAPPVRLLVVGDGPGRAALEGAAGAAGIAGITEFTGAVDHAAVPGLLSRVDVAVAPYPDLPDFYFSPLKLYEYLSAGLPVVASRVGQVAEAIEHGVTGLLCAPGDPVALAAALDTLGRDPRLRRALGAAGRARTAATRSWDAVAERIMGLAESGPFPARAAA